jgi:hypothetical protein
VVQRSKNVSLLPHFCQPKGLRFESSARIFRQFLLLGASIHREFIAPYYYWGARRTAVREARALRAIAPHRAAARRALDL